MNKITITTLLLITAGIAAALLMGGFFDNTSTSISVQTNTSANNELGTTTPTTETATTSQENTDSTSLTKAVIAQHKSKNDCWVIVRNNVYDFTSYIPRHRGGQNVIIETCGTDATNAFTNVRKHLRPDIEAELANYLLGALVN